jgi:hypothetical protein
LRERALLLVADAVQRQLDDFLRANRVDASWGTQERILVCMTPRANAAAMLASGRASAPSPVPRSRTVRGRSVISRSRMPNTSAGYGGRYR